MKNHIQQSDKATALDIVIKSDVNDEDAAGRPPRQGPIQRAQRANLLPDDAITDAAIDLIEEDVNATILGYSVADPESSDEQSRLPSAVGGSVARPSGAAASSLAF